MIFLAICAMLMGAMIACIFTVPMDSTMAAGIAIGLGLAAIGWAVHKRGLRE